MVSEYYVILNRDVWKGIISYTQNYSNQFLYKIDFHNVYLINIIKHLNKETRGSYFLATLIIHVLLGDH